MILDDEDIAEDNELEIVFDLKTLQYIKIHGISFLLLATSCFISIFALIEFNTFASADDQKFALILFIALAVLGILLFIISRKYLLFDPQKHSFVYLLKIQKIIPFIWLIIIGFIIFTTILFSF